MPSETLLLTGLALRRFLLGDGLTGSEVPCVDNGIAEHRDRLTQLAEHLARAALAPDSEPETPCPDALTLENCREARLGQAAVIEVATHLAVCAVCPRVAAGALVAPGEASKG